MAEQNRVTPYGEIVATPLRGRWIGNRGCIHRERRIVRPWNGKRWIACALSFKGWIAPKWEPRRWTALFFHDEAVALAAGHRPCALCRRADYEKYCARVSIRSVDAIDARLHAERLDGRAKRLHATSWRDLPDGVFVEVDGAPHLVLADHLRTWNVRDGYAEWRTRPRSGGVRAITPPLSILAIRLGYAPQIALFEDESGASTP